MTVADVLIALYPAPVRRRWGAELGDEIARSGARSWPNAIVAAAGLWIRPALWPETRPGERRHVLATFAVAVTAATALVVRATGTPTTGPAVGLGWGWACLVIAGMLVAAPVPRLRWNVLRRLFAVGVRTMALPMLAGGSIIAFANSPLDEYAAGRLHPAFVACYWLTLLAGARQGCAFVGRTAGLADPPGPQRLRLALALIGSGLCVAVIEVLATVRDVSPVAGLATALPLAALGAAVLVARHDLPGTVS